MKCKKVKLAQILHTFCTECVKDFGLTMEKNSKLLIFDLDKLNLVILGYGGLILDSGQFLQLPQLPQK